MDPELVAGFWPPIVHCAKTFSASETTTGGDVKL
jgi:hypothetical protein